MKIVEVKAKKRELERQLVALLQDFESQTGMNVEGLEVKRMTGGAGSSSDLSLLPKIGVVRVRVALY